MAFQLDCRREPGREIMRVIRAEIADARRHAELKQKAVAERVHHARAACKRIRSALQLLREAWPELYERENSWFRDSARRLARLRDVEVMLACLRDLSCHPASGQRGTRFFAATRLRLLSQQRVGRNEYSDPARELARFCRRMRTAERRLAAELLEPVRFASLQDGFTRTYRRARRAMPRRIAGKAGRFHTWRKKTKLCGNQCRLLRGMRPKAMKKLWHQFDELGKILGAEHDLSMLRQLLGKMDAPEISERLAADGKQLLKRRRDELRRAALALGRRLFADRPCDVGQRLRRWNG